MRKLAGLLLFISILAQVGCKQKAKTTSETEKTEEVNEEFLKNFHALDLTAYGVFGTIMVPEGKAEISENAYGGVEVRVGKEFMIEILPSALSIEEKKKELSNNPIYKIDYIEEKPKYIFYTKEIENSGIEKEHHLYYRKDFGDGEIYAIKTLDIGKLSKSNVEDILKSLKANPAV